MSIQDYILAALIMVLFLLIRRHIAKVEASQQAARQEREASAQAPVVRLNIPDTEPLNVNRGFVKGFGFQPGQVKEIRVFKGTGPLASFPEKIQKLMRITYDTGFAHGLEIAETLFKNRHLEENERVYFLLLSEPTNTIASFIGRAR